MPFSVAASYPSSCQITAAPLKFGSLPTLTDGVSGSTALTTTCSAATPYNVSLDGGAALATDPTQRKMSRSGSMITYGLYKDAASLQPWGNTPATSQAGTGTGTAQQITVFGRIPAQLTPAAGTYTDTIVATISY